MSNLTCKGFGILHFRGIILYQLVKKTMFMGNSWVIANLIRSGFINFSITSKVYSGREYSIYPDEDNSNIFIPSGTVSIFIN